MGRGVPNDEAALWCRGPDRARAGVAPARADCGADWRPGLRVTVDDVRTCPSAGADIEAREKDGRTLQDLAVVYGASGAVAALPDAGANPKVRSKDGETPLDLARKNEKLTGTKAYRRLNDAEFR